MRAMRCLLLAIGLVAIGGQAARATRNVDSSGPFEEATFAAGPREEALLADLADGELADFRLVEAVLVAQGTETGSRLEEARALLAEHGRRLRAAAAPLTTQPQRAELAFAYLHGELLTGDYCRQCSDLVTTLERGDYNCLSATILYMALCDQLHLPVVAMARPGHVYCRLECVDTFVVETTCPQWFSLDEASRRQSIPRPATASGGQFVGSAWDAAGKAESRPLSRAALLGKVYYNRGLSEMWRERFSVAAEMFSLACRLDSGDEAALENMLAALNNGALALAAEGRWQEAAEKILAGLRIDPSYPPLAANDLHIHRQWIAELAAEGREAEAASILADLARRQDRPELAAQWGTDLGIGAWRARRPAHGLGASRP